MSILYTTIPKPYNMSRDLYLQTTVTDTFVYKCDNNEYVNTYVLSKLLRRNQELIDVFAEVILKCTGFVVDVGGYWIS